MRQSHSWLRTILFGIAFGVTFLSGSAVVADAPAQLKKPKVVELLFVQNARAVEMDEAKGTLTLKDVSPTTLFFSDRPVRIAGHYLTRDEFLPLWDEGKDSFLKDPPNGTLSVFETADADLVDVVVKLQNPRMDGDDLIYDITLISGELPKSGGPAALFIDIIGMPWTPLSYAGVASLDPTSRGVWFGHYRGGGRCGDRFLPTRGVLADGPRDRDGAQVFGSPGNRGAETQGIAVTLRSGPDR
jgi:hypothetical protein